MGNDINHKLWYDKKKRKVLLLGLPKSGKTTFYEKLVKKGFLMTYTPTVDANIADVQYNNLTLILFDLSGGDRQRIFWRHHFLGTQGVIYFIDIAETEENLAVSVKELKQLLCEKELKGAIFLVYLNKIDLKSDGNVTLETLLDKLDLKEERKDMRIKIELCSISKGEGIKEGMDWLSRTMIPL